MCGCKVCVTAVYWRLAGQQPSNKFEDANAAWKSAEKGVEFLECGSSVN